MSNLMASALGIGIACFIWPLVAGAVGIPVWIGFVGCTSYYAAGAGKTGSIKALGGNLTGILWAMLVFAFYGTSIMQGDGSAPYLLGALATGIISWGMTYQARLNFLSIIPATFMGCFSTFASGGEWKLMVAGVICGNLLGLSCDNLGKLIYKLFGDKSEAIIQPQTDSQTE